MTSERKAEHFQKRRLRGARELARDLGYRVANGEIAVEEALKQVRESLDNHPDLQQRLDDYRARN